MAHTRTSTHTYTPVDIQEMPTYKEFTSGAKGIYGTTVEIRIASWAHASSDGIMDALPVEIYIGVWNGETFTRAYGDQPSFPGVLAGNFNSKELRYSAR